ncbi:MAG: response regulator transcription factor [Oscillospiraceae bacterium]
MYRIFIVEDDFDIANSIRAHLEGLGFEAKTAENFRDILAEYAAFNPHLTLMDIGLPAFNGMYWCSEIRRTSRSPIIFLSSASDNMNIVMAMDMGGDDFIAKPFDLTVLVAKIRALLRRAYDFAGSDVVEYNGVQLNLSDASLVYRGEKTELTKNEFRILQTLMENSGKIVSRDTLMSRLWETDCYIDENALSVNISRLRKKLENAGLHDYIRTKSGLGYMVG